MALAYMFIGALAAGVGVLCWYLWKRKPTTYTAPVTPKMDQALNFELEALEKKIVATVAAKEKRKVLAEVKALKSAPDQMDRLRRLAEMAKAL